MKGNLKRKAGFYLCLAVTLSLLAAPRGTAQNLRSGNFWEEDVVFEIVGQAQAVSPTTAIQFGYLSSIAELEGIFTTAIPSGQNESTALFTFFNDVTPLRAIVNGGLTIANREGTMTIYYDPSSDGNFSDPASFNDGIAVQTSAWRHQAIFEPATGKFTLLSAHTVTSAERFDFGGQQVQLGKPGDRFRIVGSGILAGPGQFKLAGYAVSVGKN